MVSGEEAEVPESIALAGTAVMLSGGVYDYL